MEAIDDVMGLVSVYPLDGFSVDDLRRAAHGVVQLEAELLLCRHAGKPPLHRL